MVNSNFGKWPVNRLVCDAESDYRYHFEAYAKILIFIEGFFLYAESVFGRKQAF